MAPRATTCLWPKRPPSRWRRDLPQVRHARRSPDCQAARLADVRTNRRAFVAIGQNICHNEQLCWRTLVSEKKNYGGQRDRDLIATGDCCCQNAPKGTPLPRLGVVHAAHWPHVGKTKTWQRTGRKQQNTQGDARPRRCRSQRATATMRRSGRKHLSHR